MNPTMLWWKFGLIAFLVVIGCSDAVDRRVANKWPAALSVFAVAAWWSRAGTAGAASSCVAALIAGSLLLAPWALRLLGGGDVKVFAAAGAVVGMDHLFFLLHATAWATLVLSIATLVLQHRSILAVWLRVADASGALAEARKSKKTVPLTVAFCAAVVVTVQGSPPWQL